MRKLSKLQEPNILRDSAEDWTRDLLATAPATREAAAIERRYAHNEIKSRLKEEVSGKCAYCESIIETVSFPHIEHIRPKSRNRELTFRWTNLTMGCPQCNNKKRHTEPTPTNFVNPYTDDPEEAFSFFGSMIIPAPNDLRAQNMINLVGLDRTPLVISRAEIVSKVLAIYEQATKLPREARREFIELSMRPLVAPEARHSRVAICAQEAFDRNYATALAA